MYEQKKQDYFKNIRLPLLDLIPLENRNGNILEIGAGSGDNLVYAKKNGYAKKIFGIELVEIKNSNQRSKLFEDFIIGDIENIELKYQESMFDVIIMGDVLEHLVDPYKILNVLNRYLKSNGVFIASIPNVRNLKVFRNIFLRGDFKYTDEGILDRTHLRFFTKKNMIELFEHNGYNVKSILSNLNFRKNHASIKNKLTFGFFEEFLTGQYFIVAEKK